jgi:nitrate reductase beta subunit
MFQDDMFEGVGLVDNWQIGRKMKYPFEGVRPKRQWAMVMDLNKCIACQTCTLACKTTWTCNRGQEQMLWNNVESKPWGSYPLAWDVRALEKIGAQRWNGKTYEGKTLFEAAGKGEIIAGFTPADEDYAYPNIGEDECSATIDKGAHFTDLDIHAPWMFYLPRICNHCTYPACLSACPRQNIYKRPEDGLVLVDQSRCRGYQECIRACPYKKVFFNDSSHISEKCIGCYPAVEQGMQPQCVVNCIGKIRVQGFLNVPAKAQPDNPIDFLVHVRKVALPLFPQFGLEPNVYYIPPLNAPLGFLKQLFGPGVAQALAAYRKMADDTELLGLLRLIGSTPEIIARFKVEDGMATGFNPKGDVACRAPIVEPTYIRPYHDQARNVYRHNTP